jgi:hypothetical protein
MENNKFEKTRPATIDLESIISSLRTQKEFEHIKLYYSVKSDIREGSYKVSMGIKQHDKWIFKEVNILEERAVEYGLLFMEQRLFKNIVGYGISSAINAIKERDGK